MTLTRLRPFDQRHRAYFYGVAGFVLAAHVVLGSMIYVMPKEYDGAPPIIASVGIDLIDLPPAADGLVEADAVELVERPPEPPQTQQGNVAPVEPMNFLPVGEPVGLALRSEPIGPTLVELPELPAPRTGSRPGDSGQARAAAAPGKTEPVIAVRPARKTTPTPASTKPPRRTASRTRPAPRPDETSPDLPLPELEDVPRAIPTGPAPEPKRTGMIDRLRSKRDRN